MTFLTSDTRKYPFQKGKSITPPCKGKSATPPCKAVRGRFLRQKQEANGANADYRWNSPLKKGDKGGCFLSCLNPVIMSFQPEDVQKPTPHSFSKGGLRGIGSVALSQNPITRLICECSSTGRKRYSPSRINLRDSNPVRGDMFIENGTTKHIFSSVRSGTCIYGSTGLWGYRVWVYRLMS